MSTHKADHFTPIPPHYRGVWKRTLLRQAGVDDTTTLVYWLQTSVWHADLRIPEARPCFASVTNLEDCSKDQLDWLSRQQGFAGYTEVTRLSGREKCAWNRLLDLQPPAQVPDEGWMEFGQQRLVEQGVHADYLEHWDHVPESDDGYVVLCRKSPASETANFAELLLIAGRYVMYLRNGRDITIQNAPAQPPARSPVEKLKDLLNLEISFGTLMPDGWLKMHSSLPWEENKVMKVTIIDKSATAVWLLQDGMRTEWEVLEWTMPKAAR